MAIVKADTYVYGTATCSNLKSLGFEAPTIRAGTRVKVTDVNLEERWAIVEYTDADGNQATGFMKPTDLKLELE